LKIPKHLSGEAKKILIKLLNRDPKKRPSLSEIDKEDFFGDIDWDRLERKELMPPIVLQREDLNRDEWEKMLKKGGKEKFSDEDYSESNQVFQRVKNYSFSRI